MSGPVDVLSVLDRLIGNTRTMAGITGDPRTRDNLRDAEQARAAVVDLIEASREYYTGYCQDEADDDAVEFCCSADQNRAAKRLRDALALCGVTP